MEHIEARLLAAIALDEDCREECGPHLDRCQVCSAELAALMTVVDSARACSPADVPLGPPERVWSAVRRAMGRSVHPEGD